MGANVNIGIYDLIYKRIYYAYRFKYDTIISVNWKTRLR